MTQDEPAAPLRKFRRQTPDQRRQALMDAALRCLAHHGAEKTSIRTICQEAGVSVGLINHYYSGKEALIADVYEQLANDQLAALRGAMDDAGPGARARLSAFFRASFSPVTLDSGLLRVWLSFWSMAQQSAPIAAAHDRTYRAYRETLEGVLGELAREAAGRGLDVRLAAIGLSGVLDGLWVEWCLDPDTFTPEEGVRLCEACLEGLLAGVPPAPPA
ncbi:MAG: TetR family transcriptional regulator C-terminal domain-containing protein [Halofilum sp. (in: g-proteobacteria)]|nr:TetR family transcriptional regulator C-terminal domain-containing protein [Halofilum sp. (in: g-proteobacteria)]